MFVPKSQLLTDLAVTTPEEQRPFPCLCPNLKGASHLQTRTRNQTGTEFREVFLALLLSAEGTLALREGQGLVVMPSLLGQSSTLSEDGSSPLRGVSTL